MKGFKSNSTIRRLISALLVPFLIAGLIIFNPDPSHAARGGRIGGGSFRAPAMPRSGSYGSGGYRGGYGGGYGGSYRRGYGGGMGFPFIIPIFGFGGGGLFGFLILMTIVGVIANAFRGNNTPAINSSGALTDKPSGPVTLLQIQIGLLASAKELQEDLRKLAASADTSSSTGLQRVLQDTSLALLRHPDLWVYSNMESGVVPFYSAEGTFNRLSITERSKLQEEITSNVSGKILSEESPINSPGGADATNEYIVVTLLIASRSQVKINTSNSNEQLKDNLRILGSTSSADLIALEVIWQPEGQGDVLSAEELITTYPNLQHL